MSLGYYRALMNKPNDYEPESSAYFARSNSNLSKARRVIIDNTIKEIKTGHSLPLGVSNLQTIIYRMKFFAIQSQSTEDWRLDFFDDANNAADRDSGNAEFESDRGIYFNADSSDVTNPSYSNIAGADPQDFFIAGFFTEIKAFTTVEYQGVAGTYSTRTSNPASNLAIGSNGSNYFVGGRLNQNRSVSNVNYAPTSLDKDLYAIARNGNTVTVSIGGVDVKSETRTPSDFPSGLTSIGSYKVLNRAVQDPSRLGFQCEGVESLIDFSVLDTAIKNYMTAIGVTGI